MEMTPAYQPEMLTSDQLASVKWCDQDDDTADHDHTSPDSTRHKEWKRPTTDARVHARMLILKVCPHQSYQLKHTNKLHDRKGRSFCMEGRRAE